MSIRQITDDASGAYPVFWRMFGAGRGILEVQGGLFGLFHRITGLGRHGNGGICNEEARGQIEDALDPRAAARGKAEQAPGQVKGGLTSCETAGDVGHDEAEEASRQAKSALGCSRPALQPGRASAARPSTARGGR